MEENDDCGVDDAVAAPSSVAPMPGATEPDGTISTEHVIAALRTVFDPEIPVNVYDLGLIYRIEAKGAGGFEIDMTLTAPACPVAGEMLNWVRNAVKAVEGVGDVQVNLVFDPPWDQSKMSDEAKLELGFI